MIRPIFRLAIINLIVWFLLDYSFNHIQLVDTQALILVALLFTGYQQLVSPFVEILFAPVNLITFGLLRWIPTVLSFLAIDWLVTGFQITSLKTPSLSYQNLNLPSFVFGDFTSIIITILVYSLVMRLVNWLLD